MMEENQHDWVQTVRAQGWADLARTGLDALAPLGVLGAQLVWLSQPVLSLFWGRSQLARLAEALETPEGLDRLRAQLDNADAGDTPDLRDGTPTQGS